MFYEHLSTTFFPQLFSALSETRRPPDLILNLSQSLFPPALESISSEPKRYGCCSTFRSARLMDYQASSWMGLVSHSHPPNQVNSSSSCVVNFRGGLKHPSEDRAVLLKWASHHPFFFFVGNPCFALVLWYRGKNKYVTPRAMTATRRTPPPERSIHIFLS